MALTHEEVRGAVLLVRAGHALSGLVCGPLFGNWGVD